MSEPQMEDTETLEKHCNPATMSEGGDMLQEQCNSNMAVEGYNFSSLPECVWVQIMQFLHLKSRYSLSLTCSAIYEHFHHPSLWHQLTIHLLRDKTNLLIRTTTVKNMEKFGHLAKRLTLIIHTTFDDMGNQHCITFDDSSRELVTKLSEVCRLDSLTIDAGKLGLFQKCFSRIASMKSDMKIFVSFIKNACRLKTLNIRSWPKDPLPSDQDYDMCSAITGNQNLRKLESLSLFWRGDEHWQEREPFLLSPTRTLPVLMDMKKLSYLALKSPMLSSEILMLLASPERSKLKLLKIDIAYSSSNSDFRIPNVSCDAWSGLTQRSPELKVECSAMTLIPDTDLSTFLKPEMPLSSMTFLRHSRCTGEMMSSIADKFHGSLRTFHCYHGYGATSAVERELVLLVNKCSKLNSLLFHGTISCSSVIAIATKTRKWTDLEFLEKKIETLEDNGDDNDDEVIRRNQEGELFLVDLNRFHQTDDNRGENINQLIDIVSEAIGYKWHPI